MTSAKRPLLLELGTVVWPSGLPEPGTKQILTAPQLGSSQTKEPDGWPAACRGGPSVGARAGTGGGSGDLATSLSSSFMDFLSSSWSSSSSSTSSSSSLVWYQQKQEGDIPKRDF